MPAPYSDASTHTRTPLLRGSRLPPSFPRLIVFGGQNLGGLRCRGGFIFRDRSRHLGGPKASSITDLTPLRRVTKHEPQKVPRHLPVASTSYRHIDLLWKKPHETTSKTSLTSTRSLVVFVQQYRVSSYSTLRPSPHPESTPPLLSRFHGTPVAHLGAETLLTLTHAFLETSGHTSSIAACTDCTCLHSCVVLTPKNPSPH